MIANFDSLLNIFYKIWILYIHVNAVFRNNNVSFDIRSIRHDVFYAHMRAVLKVCVHRVLYIFNTEMYIIKFKIKLKNFS